MTPSLCRMNPMQMEVSLMVSERLRTLRQLAERNPAFTEGALRWHVFNAKTNGLDSAIVRIGRRVLIDEQAFSQWLERHRGAA